MKFDTKPTTTAADGDIAMWGFGDGTLFALDTSSQEVWTYQVHEDTVVGIVIADSHFLTFSHDTLRVWSPPRTRAAFVAGVGGNIFNVTFDLRQLRAVIDSSRGASTLFSLDGVIPRVTSLHSHDGIAFSSAWCGASACTGGWDSAVRCTDPKTGAQRVLRTPGFIRWITSAGEACFFASADGSVWSTNDTAPVYSHGAEPTRLDYNPAVALLASIDVAGTLTLYDVRERNIVATVAGAHSAPVPQLKWAGDSLWTLSVDGKLKQWDQSLALIASYQLGGPGGFWLSSRFSGWESAVA